jgi:hypothetical protein
METTPPGTEEIDSNPPQGRKTNRGNPTGESSQTVEALMLQNQQLMMQNISMLSSSSTNLRTREEDRKSMISKIIREDGLLFTLFSAESWREDHPRLSSFTKELMANKDIQVALAQIKRKAMEWPGLISQKQLAKFLRNGFIDPDLEESPGGFTVFISRPSGFPGSLSSKEEYNSMRSLLGDKKLDADSIGLYAETIFLLPSLPAISRTNVRWPHSPYNSSLGKNQ